MKKRWLLNLALAVFVAGLALLAIYQPGAPDKEGAVVPLTTLQTETIERIRVLPAGREEMAFERNGEEWRLTAPFRARADRFRVDGLLQLAKARTEGSFPAQDLGTYGLEQPLATVWLNDIELRFGAAHAINPYQYALYNGAVHLVPSSSFRPASWPLEDFLSKNLLESDRKPTAFTLPGFRLTLKDGSWQRAPTDPELSGDRINEFVEEWRHARALEVRRHEPRPAVGRITVDYQEGEASTGRLEVDILAFEPELILYRKDEGLDYHFPQGIGERLLELKPQ